MQFLQKSKAHARYYATRGSKVKVNIILFYFIYIWYFTIGYLFMRDIIN